MASVGKDGGLVEGSIRVKIEKPEEDSWAYGDYQPGTQSPGTAARRTLQRHHSVTSPVQNLTASDIGMQEEQWQKSRRDIGEFICQECNLLFSHFSSLQQHNRKFHGGKNLPGTTQKQTKIVSIKSTKPKLTSHEADRLENRQDCSLSTCGTCGESYVHINSLKQYLRDSLLSSLPETSTCRKVLLTIVDTLTKQNLVQVISVLVQYCVNEGGTDMDDQTQTLYDLLRTQISGNEALDTSGSMSCGRSTVSPVPAETDESDIQMSLICTEWKGNASDDIDKDIDLELWAGTEESEEPEYTPGLDETEIVNGLESQPCINNVTYDTQNPHQNNIPNPLHVNSSPLPLFECKTCNKCFKTNTKLKNHLKQVDNHEGRYKCPICNKRFSNRSNFDCHVQENHLYESMDNVSSEKVEKGDEKEETCNFEKKSFAGKHSKPSHPICKELSVRLVDISRITGFIERCTSGLISDADDTKKVDLTSKDSSVAEESEQNSFPEASEINQHEEGSSQSVNQCATDQVSEDNEEPSLEHMSDNDDEPDADDHDQDNSSVSFINDESLTDDHEPTRNTNDHSGAFDCWVCKKTFQKHKRLQRHLSTIHKACHLCETSVSTKEELLIHVKSHSAVTCEFCNKQYPSRAALRRHHQDHPEHQTSSCNLCQNARKKLQLCELCGEVYRELYCLRAHQLRHHPEQAKVFEKDFKVRHKSDHMCELCGKVLASQYNLQCHYASFHLDKKMVDKCVYLDLDGSSKDGMDIKPFSGSTSAADDVSEGQQQSDQHPPIQKPFAVHQCPFCPKVFGRRDSLVIHLRTHTGERPYECLTCHRRFTQRSSFKAHAKVHTGERYSKYDQEGRAYKRRKIYATYHQGAKANKNWS